MLSPLSGEVATGSQPAGFDDQRLPGADARSIPRWAQRQRKGAGAAPHSAFAPERASQGIPDLMSLAYAMVRKAPAEPAPAFAERWNTWGTAYGGYNHTGGDPAVIGSHDLAARTGGLSGGPRLSAHARERRGLCARGRRHQLEPRATGSAAANGDAFQAGVYGTTRFGPAYLSAALAYTAHWMSTDRFALWAIISPRASTRSARRPVGERLSLCDDVLWDHALRGDAGAELPHAELRRDRRRRRRLRPQLCGRTATDTRGELGARFDRLTALNPARRWRCAPAAWAHDWASDPGVPRRVSVASGRGLYRQRRHARKGFGALSAGADFASQRRLARGKFDGEFAGAHPPMPAPGPALRLVKRRWRRHRMDPPNTQPCNKNSARCAARSCRMILNCILAARDSRNTDNDKTYPRALTAFRPRGSGSTAAAARPAAGVT